VSGAAILQKGIQGFIKGSFPPFSMMFPALPKTNFNRYWESGMIFRKTINQKIEKGRFLSIQANSSVFQLFFTGDFHSRFLSGFQGFGGCQALTATRGHSKKIISILGSPLPCFGYEGETGQERN